MKKIFSFLFALLVLIKMSKRFWSMLNLLFPKLGFLFQDRILMVLIICFMGIFFGSSLKKLEKKYILFMLIFLFCLIFSTFTNLKSDSSFLENFSLLLSSYILVVYLIISKTININIIDGKICEKTILYFSFFQGILGIIQHISKNAIVPIINSQGDAIVSSIYYLNGASSNKIFFIQQAGAQIRAFGMTDSALTLGLFMLLSIAIIFTHDDLVNKFTQYLFLAVYVTTIIFTLTRIVYFASLILIIIYLFKGKMKITKSFYYISLLLQLVVLIVANHVDKISNYFTSAFFSSFISRLEGYKFFLNYYGFSVRNFLFGFDNVSYGNFLKSIYTIDNELLNMYMDIGVIGCAIVFYIIGQSLDSCEENIPMDRAFISLFTFLGVTNSVYYFFSGVALFMNIIYKRRRPSVKIENEKQN
ncbi:hypothetical protein [Liquorilactobacillus uvarum]|uniref:Uncharacterized protein n=1 Tax=Liquorilactobacillus uvarum DSM 19971 TaxID=1423812 RepID=A0A0R1Q5W9_9LACO|nr:hypothetical protein [Liquorilactobacillus uvarum]KRL36675.1 hypothetical protein FD20_GL001138 [Liquorilactobacillus uvarum DSM 19971]